MVAFLSFAFNALWGFAPRFSGFVYRSWSAEIRNPCTHFFVQQAQKILLRCDRQFSVRYASVDS